MKTNVYLQFTLAALYQSYCSSNVLTNQPIKFLCYNVHLLAARVFAINRIRNKDFFIRILNEKDRPHIILLKSMEIDQIL